MPKYKITKYRITFWTKGYNKGKISALLDTEDNHPLMVENLSSEQGTFLIEMLRGPGELIYDPDSPEGLIYLNWEAD
ncbi:hypothetical protein KQH54_00600 [bacterium]|nr:hypothetical protein [bacterium]